jgi:hypothetical protein
VYRTDADSECTAQAELVDAEDSGAMRVGCVVVSERERDGLVGGARLRLAWQAP